MFTYLLDVDKSLLLQAQGIIPKEYAIIIQIFGESIVFFCAIMLISLWLYGVYKKDPSYKLISLRILGVIVLTFSLYALINLGLPQWRMGAMELTGADALIPHPTDNSFPSGHALFSGALLIGLLYHFRRKYIILFAFILTLITGIARILGGIHYPGDILGGLIFGFLGGYLSLMAIQKDLFEKYIFPALIRMAHMFRL